MERTILPYAARAPAGSRRVYVWWQFELLILPAIGSNKTVFNMFLIDFVLHQEIGSVAC